MRSTIFSYEKKKENKSYLILTFFSSSVILISIIFVISDKCWLLKRKKDICLLRMGSIIGLIASQNCIISVIMVLRLSKYNQSLWRDNEWKLLYLMEGRFILNCSGEETSDSTVDPTSFPFPVYIFSPFGMHTYLYFTRMEASFSLYRNSVINEPQSIINV